MENIRILTEEDFEEIFALSQFAFQYQLSSEELEQRKAETRDHKVLGWMENHELAGKVHIIPFHCYINGETFKMGGIASAATWPEYRRQGIIKQLLYRSLIEMKSSGQVVSFLHPFAFSFYRKYGWELTFINKHYEIPIELLKRKWNTEGNVRRIHNNISLLHKIYSKYAKQYNGMLVRSRKWWKYRVLDKDLSVAIALNEGGEEEGYIIFKVRDRIFTVKEMVYNTLNGWKLLLEFIANHDSMAHLVKLVVPENDQLPLLLNEPKFKQDLIPYFMARIVDVQSFLEIYPFKASNHEVKFSIHVYDEFFPENSGIYQLTIVGSEVNILYDNKGNVSSDIQCTIQQLTSLFLGFKRPTELYNLGLMKGDFESISQLEQVIPKQQTFLPDFF